MDRRGRMSVAGSVKTAGAGKAGGGKEKTLQGRGLENFAKELEADDAKWLYVTSDTDAVLEKKRAFDEKDLIILAPSKLDAEAVTSWAQEKIAWCCKKGLKPESPNQDSVSVMVKDKAFAMYGVYDGHGPEGHHASDMALRTLMAEFLQSEERATKPEETLKKVFMKTQDTLRESSKGKGPGHHDFSSSGTTCTIVYHDIPEDVLYVAHVGDSRCVLGDLDGGSKKKTLALTKDHKPDEPLEKKRIESANPPGRVIFDGYFNHRVFSQKGMYPGLNMSRAMGDLVAHDEAGLTAEPDVTKINLKTERAADQNLVLLVCTDGVWEFVPNEEAVDIAAKGYKDSKGKVQAAAEKLTKEAYDRWMKDSDGEITDDISAIVVVL
mmetsp:Transcript_32370/g.58811  ORF Transcript_32370/g.58811 Transcript_32370/m.58811 type:complete len:380 (-) Transcript_32370:119-1258(-)|eukprot:CAMPEP_0197634842 /NCGR_PEP_ID=MMETSP1338-20131121/10825_1 /TAXON_ID=43686 ORGANISM="Pelagodinium beii, Strain RCC1491" /NCGR_SAMPLE_ID=MMETSP1338 /ASSEMBLY_ACC=CAM_ASM_000754 /LENGTH=379 /DNA_ID=CAMNT_0043206785 /DNA_START=81 /DNA_END=1220 /DNA_ORIENTATION=+